MDLYICRAGVVEGPHSIAKVQEMLQQGRVTPYDLGAHAGVDDWSPLCQLLSLPAGPPDHPAGPPDHPAGPPPLPAAPEARYLDEPFLVKGGILPGTEGKSVRQIIDEIPSGGRFVMFQYVFSLIILTFRRNSPICYLAPGRSGAGAAFGWSLIPLCCGWWGIPWGIIHTIGALWRNSAGGVDVTEPILAQLIGPQQADALIQRRPKQPSGVLWGLRALFFSPLVVVPLLIVMMAASGSRHAKARATQPGYARFSQANSFMNGTAASGSQGNTPAANEAARSFATFMRSFRAEAITGNQPSSTTTRHDDMLTWCEVHGDRCLFIVKVPDLRHFDAGSKTALGDAAWFAAHLCATKLGLANNANLAVAVRGSLVYDRLITGRHMADIHADSPDLETRLRESIQQTKTGGPFEDQLIPYFANPTR